MELEEGMDFKDTSSDSGWICCSTLLTLDGKGLEKEERLTFTAQSVTEKQTKIPLLYAG